MACVKWNRIIEDTPELMKKIVFPIWHPIPFLQLPIAKNRKATSIIFKNSFPIKQAFKFINMIKKTVERVKFVFVDGVSSKDQQRQLFILILQQCKSLRELVIKGERKQSNGRMQSSKAFAFLNQPAQQIGFGFNIDSMHLELSAVSNISILSVDMENLREDETNGLIQKIQIHLLLPKLEIIQLSGCNFYHAFDLVVLFGLCKYIEKYKSDLYLKAGIN